MRHVTRFTMLAWHRWLESVNPAQALQQSISKGNNLWIRHCWDAKLRCCKLAFFIPSSHAKTWQGAPNLTPCAWYGWPRTLCSQGYLFRPLAESKVDRNLSCFLSLASTSSRQRTFSFLLDWQVDVALKAPKRIQNEHLPTSAQANPLESASAPPHWHCLLSRKITQPARYQTNKEVFFVHQQLKAWSLQP